MKERKRKERNTIEKHIIEGKLKRKEEGKRETGGDVK